MRLYSLPLLLLFDFRPLSSEQPQMMILINRLTVLCFFIQNYFEIVINDSFYSIFNLKIKILMCIFFDYSKNANHHLN